MLSLFQHNVLPKESVNERGTLTSRNIPKQLRTNMSTDTTDQKQVQHIVRDRKIRSLVLIFKQEFVSRRQTFLIIRLRPHLLSRIISCALSSVQQGTTTCRPGVRTALKQSNLGNTGIVKSNKTGLEIGTAVP